MIRCSCHGLHGCVPVDAERDAERIGERAKLRAALADALAQSANVSQRPVRTSTSEAISSPTRCGSSSVPAAAACTSSKRFDELERRGVEERELLLDRDREVGASSNAPCEAASSSS